jgi:hypothetical protein
MRVRELRPSRDCFAVPSGGGHGDEYGIECLSAGRSQDIAVPVPFMALYPSLGNRSVDSALEIAVPNLKELVPPENARDRDFVPSEYRQNLLRGVVTINLWNCHRIPPLQRGRYAQDRELEGTPCVIPVVIESLVGSRKEMALVHLVFGRTKPELTMGQRVQPVEHLHRAVEVRERRSDVSPLRLRGHWPHVGPQTAESALTPVPGHLIAL